MDKKQIIQDLEAQKESINRGVIEDDCFDYEYKIGWKDGAVEAYGRCIGLIKQMKDEPITAEELQAAGWIQSPLSWDVYTKSNGKNNFELTIISVKLIAFPPEILVFFNNVDGTMIYPKATTMAHLRVLEEMFLS